MNEVFNFPIQCLRHDQRVLTTNGWKPISMLVPGVDTLLQPSGQTTSNFKLRSTGTREIYEVRTQGRRVFCTHMHRFLRYVKSAKVSWTLASNLRKDLYIAVATPPAVGGYDPPGVNPEIAEVLGVLIGDGSYSGRGFVITCTTRRHADRLKRFTRRTWPDLRCTVRRVTKTEKEHMQLWVLSAESRLADARLEQLQLPSATARNKRVPAWAETATFETRCGLLRGLFDADGGFAGELITFTSTSRQLARSVHRLLLSVGVAGRFHRMRGPVYRVYIRPASVSTFRRHVGFASPTKKKWLETRKAKNPITRLPPDLVAHVAHKLAKRIPRSGKTWTSLDHSRLTRAQQGSSSREQLHKILETARPYATVDDLGKIVDQLDYEQVVSVRKTGRTAKTFDLTIPGPDHGYVAEGLVTHNSSASDLMALGLLNFLPKLKRYGTAFPILQIHDAMVFECDEDDAEPLKADMKAAFEQQHTYRGTTVFFPIDAAIAKSWAEV